MMQITNRQKGTTQIVIKSKTHLNSFTVKNIPGIGAGRNVIFLPDELMTENVERTEKDGLISTKYIRNN